MPQYASTAAESVNHRNKHNEQAFKQSSERKHNCPFTATMWTRFIPRLTDNSATSSHKLLSAFEAETMMNGHHISSILYISVNSLVRPVLYLNLLEKTPQDYLRYVYSLYTLELSQNFENTHRSDSKSHHYENTYHMATVFYQIFPYYSNTKLVSNVSFLRNCFCHRHYSMSTIQYALSF